MGKVTNIHVPDNRGGARKGAGRPKKGPITVSEKMRGLLVKAEEKIRQDLGKGIAESIVELVMDDTANGQTRVMAAKLFYEVTAGTQKEITHTENKAGPTIYLPEENAS